MLRIAMFALGFASLAVVTPSVAQNSDERTPLQQGEIVFGQWGDGSWYPGRITQIDGQQYTVTMFDGDVITLPLSKVRRNHLREGYAIEVRRPGSIMPAVLLEIHGEALVVAEAIGKKYDPETRITSTIQGEPEAIEMADLVITNMSGFTLHPDPETRPAVLANICNNHSERVYYALATDTYNAAMVGNASVGWRKVEPGTCNIENLTNFWNSETRYPDDLRYTAPTYIYGRTEAAFGSTLAGGVISFGTGLRWSGEDGENEYCILDRTNVSFRHIVDVENGLTAENYCQYQQSFTVPFREIAIPGRGANRGAAVHFTFGS